MKKSSIAWPLNILKRLPTAFNRSITNPTGRGQTDSSAFDLDEVAQRLENEGIEKFITPYDKIVHSIEAYRANR